MNKVFEWLSGIINPNKIKASDRQYKAHQRLETLVAEGAHTLALKTQELLIAEERLRLAMEAARAGVWDWNIQTGETYCTPNYFAILGYEPYQFCGNVNELFIDLVHPDDCDHTLSYIYEQLNESDHYEIEFRMRDSKGSYQWIRSQGKLVQRDSEGLLLRAVGTHCIITDQKKTAQALIESENRFREMANSAPVMIWLSGLDKLCYFFNKTWLDFTGRSQEQEIGNGWAEGVHPDDLDTCLKIYIESFDAQQPFKMDYRLRRHDGTFRWIQDSGVPRYDGQGSFLGYIGSCIDISDRKEAEDYFKVIVEASPNAILLLNEEGRIELVNHELTRLFGYTRDELIGQLIEILVPTEIAKQHVQLRNAYLSEPEACEIGKERIVSGRKKDGSTFQAEIGLNPFSMGDRNYVVSVVVDVTKRKETERSILELNASLEAKVQERTEALEKASASKSDFLANMSHEIRNPLNIISLCSFMLEREPLNEQQGSMIQRIRRSSKSLLCIVDEILDFSKMEAGLIDLDLSPTDFYELIQNISESHIPLAMEKGLRLNAETPHSGIPTLILDAIKVEKILRNLLSNAIKFTHEGDVWFRVHVTQVGMHNVSVYFEVRDTGVGIPAESIPNLGKPFTQADSTVTRKFGGTGLGLSICKRLLQLMGSDLQIQSAPGEGSTFSFELSFDIADRDNTELSRLPEAQLSLGGVSLLVVDDDPINLEGMHQLLGTNGAKVCTAESGLLAIEALEKGPEPFNIILMDLQMPIMDGFETTRLIRKLSGQEHLPVIAVTAGILPGQKREAIDAGITELLRKPVQPEELIKTIRKYVDQEKCF